MQAARRDVTTHTAWLGPMMSTGALIAIEIGLIVGGVIAFALWEVRSVRKKR